MKGVFVVISGASDEKLSILGDKSPLEYAKMPNLDFLSGKGRVDYCYPVKQGVVPDSCDALVSLLGYDYRNVNRGALEAAGLGIKLTKGDLAFRCNFSTVDTIDGSVMDMRAGRTLTGKESEAFAKAVNENVRLPFNFEFHPGLHHRGVLVFRGGFSDNITSAGFGEKVGFSQAMDDEDDSKLSAELVNSFIRQSHTVLDKHPLNNDRVRKGLFSANFLACKGAGSNIAMKKLKGRWMALNYNALESGITGAVKMDSWQIKYPKMKGIDVYSNLHAGLNKALKSGIKMIKRRHKKYDYFFIHLKETDIAGHDNKPLEKVKMLELIDKKLFGFLKGFLEKRGGKLVVTSDHTTSCRTKNHLENPVPVLSYPGEGGGEKFTEEEAMKGRKIVARKLLNNGLFGK